MSNPNLDATSYDVRMQAGRTNPVGFVLHKIAVQLVWTPVYFVVVVPAALVGLVKYCALLDREERLRLHIYCKNFWYYPSLCLHKVVEGALFQSLTLKPPSCEIGCEDGCMTTLHFPGTIFDVGVEYIAANRPTAGVHRTVVIAGLPYLPADWSGRFQTVSLVHTIDHIPSLDQSLAELRRITTPGGSVSLSGFTNGYAAQLHALSLGLVSATWVGRKKGFHHFLPLEEWRARFEAAGFRISRLEPFLGGGGGLLWLILHTVFEINGSNDLFYAANRIGVVPRFVRDWMLVPFAMMITAAGLRTSLRQPCHFFAQLEVPK